MDARESCLSHSAGTSRSVEILHLRRVPMQKLDRTCCIGITTSPQFRDLIGGTRPGSPGRTLHTRWSLKSDMAVARASIWCAKHGMTAARIWGDTAQ